MDQQDVVEMLQRRQGKQSLRSFAGEVGCSAAYLSDVFRKLRQPGPKILEYLGLGRTEQRVVTYHKNGVKPGK
jgi:hypothetical protein